MRNHSFAIRAETEGLEWIAREMRESIRRETSPEVAWELVDKFDQLVLSTMTR